MQSRLMLTSDGYRRLRAERDDLRSEDGRLAEAMRLPEGAAETPSSSATSEEDRRSRVGARIRELERMLATCRVIDAGEIDGESVEPGVLVELREQGSGATATCLLVEPPEADPAKGRLSRRSPLGEALVGRSVGERVAVAAPRGVRTYEIAAINVPES